MPSIYRKSPIELPRIMKLLSPAIKLQGVSARSRYMYMILWDHDHMVRCGANIMCPLILTSRAPLQLKE